MPKQAAKLRGLVERELTTAVDPRVRALAAAIAAKHQDSSRAVLFYGSCLREQQLEGLMLDFYLIVADYRSAYPKRWQATANRLIPPNVFYFGDDGLVSKYAVLSEADFARECSPAASTVSTVARFAQPSRLVWSADPPAAQAMVDIVSTAAPTLLGWTRPLDPNADTLSLWKRAFALTFAAELRAERSERSAGIVDSDPSRYERVGRAALEVARAERGPRQAARWWRRMQAHGKRYSVLRLAKASLTFAGGADYIAWKINRHAGTQIALTAWQRRHPLLAGIALLPRLLKSGAVR